MPQFEKRLAGVEERANLRRTGAVTRALAAGSPSFSGDAQPRLQFARNQAIGAARQQTVLGAQLRRGVIQDEQRAMEAQDANVARMARLAIEADRAGASIDLSREQLGLQREQGAQRRQEFEQTQERLGRTQEFGEQERVARFGREGEQAEQRAGFEERRVAVQERPDTPRAPAPPEPLEGAETFDIAGRIGMNAAGFTENVGTDEAPKIGITQSGQALVSSANRILRAGAGSVTEEEAIRQAGTQMGLLGVGSAAPPTSAGSTGAGPQQAATGGGALQRLAPQGAGGQPAPTTAPQAAAQVTPPTDVSQLTNVQTQPDGSRIGTFNGEQFVIEEDVAQQQQGIARRARIAKAKRKRARGATGVFGVRPARRRGTSAVVSNQ